MSIYVTNNNAADQNKPTLGIINKNASRPNINPIHSNVGNQSGLVIYLPDNKVSVYIAIISCGFFRPLGVNTNGEPENVAPMNTILPFTDDQSKSA